MPQPFPESPAAANPAAPSGASALPFEPPHGAWRPSPDQPSETNVTNGIAGTNSNGGPTISMYWTTSSHHCPYIYFENSEYYKENIHYIHTIK